MNKQAENFLLASRALYEAIEGFGDEGVPSGCLYAIAMETMPLQTYQSLIGILKEAGLITESNHILRKAMK
jgi:uncharacterized protein YutE (UPF0331/DUF86 family)